MDGLVFFKTDFADETRNTGVDGSDVLIDIGIVGPFHLSEVDEAGDDIEQDAAEEKKDDDVIEYAFGCTFHKDDAVYLSL